MSSLSILERPMSIENLPNFLIKDSQLPSESLLESQSHMEVATSFVLNLALYIKQQNCIELLTLYDFTFKRYSETVFKSTQWPSANEIEEANGNLEIAIETQVLYNELVNRYKFQQTQNISVEDRYYSWLNYKELFDLMDNMELPGPWTWDIIDELIYQFFLNSQWRSKLKQSDPEYQDLIKLDSFYTLENLYALLNKKTTNNQKSHYSKVGLLKLNVMIGNFQKAIDSIESIDYDCLPTISKSFNCYLSFFYYLSFSYLMTGCYKVCINILEALVLFTNKYKQFCSKYETMIKQSEKVLYLLTIALVLYPKKLDEIAQNLIQELLRQKYDRLKQYDMSIFNELFIKGCPKFFHPYKNLIDLKDDFNQYTLQSQTQNYKDKLSKNFLSIRTLNNVNNVLKLYSRISLQKASTVVFQLKLLKVSVQELQDMLQKQRQRSDSNLNESPFQQTILSKFQVESEQFQFTFENDMIFVSEQTTKTNYQKIYEDNNQQVNNIIELLENE